MSLKSWLCALSPLKLVTSPFWRRSWKHRLARILLGFVVFYLLMLGLLLPLENKLLFQPSVEDWSRPPATLGVENIDLTSADGTPIHAWWCPPKNWNPAKGALLYCHGNAGNLSHRAQAIRDWQTNLDEAVLIFDYPGYGKSGGKPSEAGCYGAAGAAYNWLIDQQDVLANKVILFGGSLGGGVAVDLASRRSHRALVLMSTFTSVPDVAQSIYFWAPARYLVSNRFDNLAKIERCQSPIFIAHGTDDDLIPIQFSERLFAAAPEPKQFFPMPGYRHDESLSRACYRALREFLEAHPTSSNQ
jgi:uncharacterized protein